MDNKPIRTDTVCCTGGCSFGWSETEEEKVLRISNEPDPNGHECKDEPGNVCYERRNGELRLQINSEYDYPTKFCPICGYKAKKYIID